MNANVPAGAAKLLDYIGRLETGRSGPDAYEVIVFFKQDKLPKKLTDYTIDELLAAQKTWAKNWRGSAAGKYQIIRKTLQGLVTQLGIHGSAKFSPDLQDRLGFALLTARGWQAFSSGQITPNAYAAQLAREWASIPVLSTTQGAHRQVTRGESYYAGDGVNKSQAKADEFEAVLASIRKPAEVEASIPVPPKPNRPPIEPDKSADRGPFVTGALVIGAVLAGIVMAATAAWDFIVNLWNWIF